MTDVLIIGGGAREHAIAWKLRQSPRLGALHVAPGNAGIAEIAETRPLIIPKPDAPPEHASRFLDAATGIARETRAGLVVVAPDDPLALGLADRLAQEGILAFGPAQAAARIESSKAYAKQLAERHDLPASVSATFDSFDRARRYVASRPGDVVVKADGLAAGKGAIVTSSHDEAVAALRDLMVVGVLGEAGRTVVIQDKLTGPEVSAHAFTDGETVRHMPFACDHKAAFDGGRGPNTGGMGVYTPPSWLGDTDAEFIRRQITEAAVRAMADEGVMFRGVLFPGVMVTPDGPRVIEFNARFGDPEAEALLPRLQSDLLEVMLAVAGGTLDEVDVRWSDDASVTVMLASGGYPGPYETGKPIEGLADLDPDILLFHAGTKRDDAGRLATGGGRVLAVTATAPTLAAARDRVYDNVRRIRFEGMHYRSDIGARDVAVTA